MEIINNALAELAEGGYYVVALIVVNSALDFFFFL